MEWKFERKKNGDPLKVSHKTFYTGIKHYCGNGRSNSMYTVYTGEKGKCYTCGKPVPNHILLQWRILENE